MSPLEGLSVTRMKRSGVQLILLLGILYVGLATAKIEAGLSSLKINHVVKGNHKHRDSAIAVLGNAKVTKEKSAAHGHHGISFTALVINVVADLCPHGMVRSHSSSCFRCS